MSLLTRIVITLVLLVGDFAFACWYLRSTPTQLCVRGLRWALGHEEPIQAANAQRPDVYSRGHVTVLEEVVPYDQDKDNVVYVYIAPPGVY